MPANPVTRQEQAMTDLDAHPGFAYCMDCGWIARGIVADLQPEADEHADTEGHHVKIDI